MTPTRSGISAALIEMVVGDGKPVLHLSRWSYLEPYWPSDFLGGDRVPAWAEPAALGSGW